MNLWLERLFLLLIFSLGFMQPGLKLTGMSLPATDLIFIVLAIGLLAALAFRRREIEWDRGYWYFGAFAVAMSLSAAFSIQPTTSVLKLAGVLYLVGLAIITVNVVNSAEMARKVVLVWIAASTLASLVGAVTVLLFYLDRDSPWHELFLHHYGSLPAGNYPRIQSTFLYPAMLCNYLTVGTLLALGAEIAGWLSRRSTVVVILLHLLSAAFTVTPGLGGFLFAVAAWVGWQLLDNGRKNLGLGALSAGVTAALMFALVAAISFWPIETSPYNIGHFGIRLDPTQRLLTWEDALLTFAADPVFGKGIGLGVAGVLFRAPSGQMQMLTDAHNTWLSVAAQAGIIGLTTVLALIGHVILRGWRSSLPADGIVWIRRSLLIAFIGSFVVQGLVGSFEDARHLWVLMGLIIALDRIKKTEWSG